MKNGYALPSIAGLNQVDSMLASMLEAELDTLRAKLRIGLQWDTQVTLDGCSHLVTQAYCSALPVAYGGWPAGLWKRFAMLVLEAAYEATLAVAVLNASKSGNNLVYLTLLGGGAFGNEPEWILDAMRRACRLYLPRDLDLKIVSHRSSNPGVQELVNSINGEVRKMPSPRRVRVEQDSPCHYCPGCGTAQKMFSRYPWYFCQACVSLAEDGSGRRLAFGNSSLSGGLCWKYADKVEASAEECVTVACLILGRPVMVTEARFGGVVAQPLTSQVMKLTDSYKFVDLR
jgi:hypothetical protein